jgi:hypothetical protein
MLVIFYFFQFQNIKYYKILKVFFQFNFHIFIFEFIFDFYLFKSNIKFLENNNKFKFGIIFLINLFIHNKSCKFFTKKIKNILNYEMDLFNNFLLKISDNNL